MQIIEDDIVKKCVSPEYNYTFNKVTGEFERWGRTTRTEDDPLYSMWGPEIADIEIVAGGNCLGKCDFCYKCNNIASPKKCMTFEQFKNIFHKLPKTLTQIAYGITNITANPEFFKIMEYSREHGVIPNYTTHGLDVTEEIAEKTSKLCGAVAVSVVNKEKTYDAIKKFTDFGMKQVNCHYMLSEETYLKAFEIIDDIVTDSRLKKFNAIVFLQYKDKNPYSQYHSLLNVEKYSKLIQYCDNKKINYGFDSCSAGIFIESIKEHPDKIQIEQYVDSCESMRMSIYINCLCKVFPCSFCENTEGWENGIDILSSEDFLKDIWNNDRVIKWRNNLIGTIKNSCASCPIYDLKIK